jgi:hypothetical protein
MPANPTTLNMLAQNGFQFSLEAIPSVNFFCTKANLPGFSVGSTDVKTPFATIHGAPDKIEFDSLQITFQVAADLSNWKELFVWMTALGFPKNFTQRAAFSNPLQSDGSLIILSSHKNPLINVSFKDLMPISLGGLQFNTQDSEIEYISCTAEFKFLYYEVSFNAP